MSAPPPLPRRMREVTAEWLDAVLRSRGALLDARVAGLEIERIGTFSTQLFRLRPRFDRPAPGAPESLVVKRPVPGRDERAAEQFATEIRFYEELAVETPVPTPRSFFGACDESGAALLLLEDVPDLETFHFDGGADADHCRLGLEGLARLHAHWWRRVARLGWVPSLADRAVLDGFAAAYERGWRERRAALVALCPDFAPIGDALVGRVPDALAPLGEPATLLHGDAHAENLPARSGRGGRDVVFLDWPALRRGSPGFDVAVFLAMSLPVDERRRAEREGVATHARALAAAGAESPRDAWLDYRLGILRRAIRMVEIAPGLVSGAGGGLRLVFERCLAAAVDLDVAELAG